MPFELSQRSRNNLVGVDPRLAAVVESAIKHTKIDFAVIEGVRSLDRQRELYEAGASRTMNSKHLDGLAVDLMAYLNGRASWELNLYDEIADAMYKGAIEHDVSIRWGAAWHIDDLRAFHEPMERAMNDYIDLRRKQGKRPFIDAPHFEVSE